MVSRLHAARDLKQILDVAVADVLALLGSERGNIQLLDRKGRLVIVAQLGLSREFLTAFRRVKLTEGSICARAAGEKKVVFVPDVEKDAEFAPYVQLARKIPFRSVVSSPIVTADGTFIGVVSAHSANLFAPTDLELQTLSNYCTELAHHLSRQLKADRQEIAEALSAELLAARR